MLNTKYIVVGAGIFGSVIAERIASVLNERVTVIEKRAPDSVRAGQNRHLQGSIPDPGLKAWRLIIRSIPRGIRLC